MTRSIAVDGPSGAGKSTIGFALAARIGATFVDTGLMYRALTLAALERHVDVDDGAALGALARSIRIEVEKPRPGQHDRLSREEDQGNGYTPHRQPPHLDLHRKNKRCLSL